MAVVMDGLLYYNRALVWTGARRSLCEFMISKWLFMAEKGHLADVCFFHCGVQISVYHCFIYMFHLFIVLCDDWANKTYRGLLQWLVFCSLWPVRGLVCMDVWVWNKHHSTVKNDNNKESRICYFKKIKYSSTWAQGHFHGKTLYSIPGSEFKRHIFVLIFDIYIFVAI